jgi:hypothetical protein
MPSNELQSNEMLCPKCGAMLAPDTNFCGVCGAGIDAAGAAGAAASGVAGAGAYAAGAAQASAPPSAFPPAPYPAPGQAPPPAPGAAPIYAQAPTPPLTYPTTPAPKKLGFKQLLAIGIAAVVVIAAVIGGFAAFGGNSYSKAEANFLASLGNGLPILSDKGRKITFSAEYEPEGELTEIISAMELSGIFSQLGKNASAELELSLDGAKFEFDALFDGSDLALSLPELLGTNWIKLAMLGDSGVDGGGSIDLSLLDQKKLDKTAANIFKAYYTLAKDAAEVTKGKELTGGDVAVKCDEYVITFDEQLIYALAQAAIAEVRANQNLMDFIDACGEAASYESRYNSTQDRWVESNSWDGIDRIMEDLEDAIDELMDDLDGDEGDRLFRMTVWIKGSKVIGRKIDRVAANLFSLDYRMLSSGSKAYFDANSTVPGGSASLSGKFEKSGGSWSGTPTLRIQSSASSGRNMEVFSMRANCKELKLSDGKAVGSIRLTGDASDGYGDSYSYDINLALDRNERKQQVIVVDGKITDPSDEASKLGELTLAYGVESIGNLAISMPREDDTLVINRPAEADQAIVAEMREQLGIVYDKYSDNSFLRGLLGNAIYGIEDSLY